MNNYEECVKYLNSQQAGKNNIKLEGLDLVGDLDQLKKNIALFKRGKFGKGLAEFEINDLDWIDQNSRKVKAVTILVYETSVQFIGLDLQEYIQNIVLIDTFVQK